MEGGDHQEPVPEAVFPPKNSELEAPVLEGKAQETSTALTDSILDDDLVVIPSQNEQIEIPHDEVEEKEIEQPDLVLSASDPSPQTNPEPPAAPTPESETKPSQPDEDLSPSSPPPSSPPPSSPPPSSPPPSSPLLSSPPPKSPTPCSPPPSSQSQSVSQSVPPPQPNPEPSIQTTRPQMASKVIKPSPKAIEEDDDDFEDETVMERLAALTDMFPDTLRTVTGVTFSLSVSGLKKIFSFSRSALWIGSTSFMVLILPIIFETEMVHMEQAQIQRQKQILLGPNAASAGGMTGGLTPPMPGVSVAAPPS